MPKWIVTLETEMLIANWSTYEAQKDRDNVKRFREAPFSFRALELGSKFVNICWIKFIYKKDMKKQQKEWREV